MTESGPLAGLAQDSRGLSLTHLDERYEPAQSCSRDTSFESTIRNLPWKSRSLAESLVSEFLLPEEF